MIDYLTHYYSTDREPFQSLSALSDEEAIKIMERLCDDTPLFTEFDVSFTYPDSMISHWFGRDKSAEFYQAELHGNVFTLAEILSIVEKKGMPEKDWEIKLPRHLAPYIEAQVWNHELLKEYREQNNEDSN